MILPEKINGFNRSTEKYFLFIGRLHPIKALENLIQALALSEKFKASEFVFKIVGDGEDSYKKGLEAMILELGLVEKIKLVGTIEGEKKQELYANAYFTFLISHTENFGIVVIESLAQGTPVVTSKGTPWQILEDRNAGFWVGNDVSSLASVINRISNLNAEEYNTYRENASKLVNEEYNIDSNVEKWIAAYQSL